MSKESTLRIQKARTRKRLGLKPGTSIGPAGASIVSDDGKRLKNTSGDPNKKFTRLEQLQGTFNPQREAGVPASIKRAAKESGLTEEQIQNYLKSAEQKKDIKKGVPHQGVKTDQEGNPILSIAKGGMVKKKKAKKSKVAGRLAKRGYGAAKK